MKQVPSFRKFLSFTFINLIILLNMSNSSPQRIAQCCLAYHVRKIHCQTRAINTWSSYWETLEAKQAAYQNNKELTPIKAAWMIGVRSAWQRLNKLDPLAISPFSHHHCPCKLCSADLPWTEEDEENYPNSYCDPNDDW